MAAAAVDYGHDRKYTTAPTKRYTELLSKVGTLANGGVYVSVSSLIDPVPMLGLFADRSYEAGDPVVFYGGQLTSIEDARQPGRSKTHALKLPEGGWIRDGKPFSDHFPITSKSDPTLFDAYTAELKRAPKDRVRVQPLSADPELVKYIRTHGIGYMANRPNDVGGSNVKLTRVIAFSGGVAPAEMLMEATKPISKYDEILLLYRQKGAD